VALAVINAIGNVGSAVSPLLIGILRDATGSFSSGLGRWLINAIRQQDYAAISAGVMVIGALVIIVNVISDILGAMANPLKHKEWYALR
jgi:ABC-type antimicrobial peptide transport system permease subunit